jgi:hypothetical protein
MKRAGEGSLLAARYSSTAARALCEMMTTRSFLRLPITNDLLALPVAAVKCERLGDPTPRREQEDDQGSVAQLRKRVVRQGIVEPDTDLLLDRLGQALSLLGQVDVGAENATENRVCSVGVRTNSNPRGNVWGAEITSRSLMCGIVLAKQAS